MQHLQNVNMVNKTTRSKCKTEEAYNGVSIF